MNHYFNAGDTFAAELLHQHDLAVIAAQDRLIASLAEEIAGANEICSLQEQLIERYKKLNLALADKLATISAHLGRLAEKEKYR